MYTKSQPDSSRLKIWTDVLPSLRLKAQKVIREILPYIWFQFAQFSKFDFDFFVSQVVCDTFGQMSGNQSEEEPPPV